MEYSDAIGSSIDLSDKLRAPIIDFLSEQDWIMEQKLRGTRISPGRQVGLRALWSFFPNCPDSVGIRQRCRAAGFEATSVLNEDAFVRANDIEDGLMEYTTHKSHIITKVSLGGGQEAYIDTFWQQFIGNNAFNTDELANDIGMQVLPKERVLCYQAEDVELLAGWFASVVRFVHERANHGALRGKSAMFTRRPTIVDALYGRDDAMPVAYQSIESLEGIARQIWDPNNYRAVSDLELERIITSAS